MVKMIAIESKDEVIDFIQQVRYEYLERINKGTATQNDYAKIIDFFRSSRPVNPFQRVIDDNSFQGTDYFSLSSHELQKYVIIELFSYFEPRQEEFKEICPNAQYVIWSTVFPCVESLKKIQAELKSIKVYQKANNYPDSCEFVELYLHKLARAYSLMVILENQLGIERYLATTGLEYDVKFIHSLVQDIRRESNGKLKDTKLEFQAHWNLTAISKIIKKLLGEQILEDSITCNFAKDQERVIFILIDGMGYAQYLWYREGIKSQKNSAFGLNIFEWLSQFDEYNDTLVLGSTLIPDTGSAIASIYSGKLPSTHGIYASNMYDGLNSINIKKIDGENFDKFVETCPDTFLSSLNKTTIKILDGSGSFTKKNKNSFTKFIFGEFPRERIIPQDRLFKKISGAVQNSSNKSLILGYYPLIDNTSHSIGAFTAFESVEYEKLNLIFIDMLIDLAKNQSVAFDGKTTILISADHGMFEISSKKISSSEIKQVFRDEMAIRPFVSINTRSIFLYNIPLDKIKKAKDVLQDFIDQRKIIAEVYTKTDEIIQTLLLNSERYGQTPSPDLILIIEDEGIGVSNDIEDALIFHGGHGGSSCEEVFVPLIQIRLTSQLRTEIMNHFAKIS